jgi:hypothetical protein
MSEPIMRVQAALTGRDLVLLGWLADHGVLTTEQIAAALFPSVNFAQRRLRTLLAWRLVDRFRPQRPDGGSYPYHWLLAQLGTDVIAAQRGEPVPRRDQARQRRWHLTNRANLPHLLGVNGFFTRLAAYARTRLGAELRRWRSAARCQQRGAFATRPLDDGRWDATALSYHPKSRPDGHGIFTARDHTTASFLEYDTGTEPLTRLAARDRYRTAFENGTMDETDAGPRLRELRTEIEALKLRRDDIADTIQDEPTAPSASIIDRIRTQPPGRW